MNPFSRKDREPAPPLLPREARIPLNLEPGELGDIPQTEPPEKYAPRYRSPVPMNEPRPTEDEGHRELFQRGVAAYDQLRLELATVKTQLQEALDGLRLANSEISRLQLELAQAKNDLVSATTITQDAVRAAGDWSGLVRNIQAMIGDFETGASYLPPSTARRRARVRNGEPPVVVPPVPETPASEPERAEDRDQTS